MPINIKELIVRAWVGSQENNGEEDDDENSSEETADTAMETPEYNAAMLEQLKRMLTDKKDR